MVATAAAVGQTVLAWTAVLLTLMNEVRFSAAAPGSLILLVVPLSSPFTLDAPLTQVIVL